jgi:hypothetical protein
LIAPVGEGGDEVTPATTPTVIIENLDRFGKALIASAPAVVSSV